MIAYFNKRLKLFSIFDLKLCQGIGILVGIILVKLFPVLLDLQLVWYILILIIFALRPCYVMFFKKA